MYYKENKIFLIPLEIFHIITLVIILCPISIILETEDTIINLF